MLELAQITTINTKVHLLCFKKSEKAAECVLNIVLFAQSHKHRTKVGGDEQSRVGDVSVGLLIDVWVGWTVRLKRKGEKTS